LGEDDLADQRNGVVFQSFHLIPTMTALENVATPLELAGVRDAYDRASAELAAVGLANRCRALPCAMSGGEQQRVALAASVARQKLLLADEPTGNLMNQRGRHHRRALSLREQHATVIMVTHELAARCDRIIRLRDGHIDTLQAAAE
jgi:putative ABC transport system ATP-binding protein